MEIKIITIKFDTPMWLKKMFKASILVLLVTFSSIFLFADSITIPHTFVAGDVAKASDVNENFAALSNIVNGNITNENIKEGANISRSKLAGEGAISGYFDIGDNSTTSTSYVQVGNNNINVGQNSIIIISIVGGMYPTSGPCDMYLTSVIDGNFENSKVISNQSFHATPTGYTVIKNLDAGNHSIGVGIKSEQGCSVNLVHCYIYYVLIPK